MVMLRLWLNTEGNRATGNNLEKALRKCDREDIIEKCVFNVEQVTDTSEQVHAAEELEEAAGFEAFKENLAPVNNSTMKPLKRDYSIHVNVDESEYMETQNGVTQDRFTAITEESSKSSTVNQVIEKHEEETSAYEREEQNMLQKKRKLSLPHSRENPKKIIPTHRM